MSGPAIEFDQVSCWYGDTVALANVTFALGAGVTGLLGHNGAGKSTALKLCAGFHRPNAGRVRVLGDDLARHPRGYAQVGIAHDREGLWAHLTARQTVAMLARLRRVADPESAAMSALDRVGLVDAADRAVGGFSHGMRQRVKLAQALVHQPEVLLLDEPLNGLDPGQRRQVVELVRELGAAGRCVVVSSHVLHEVERMADRVLVLVDGHLVASGSTAGLRGLLAERPRAIRVRTADPDHARRLAARLVEEGVADSARLEGDSLEVDVADADRFARRIAPLAAECGVRLAGLRPVGDDLETVYADLHRRARGGRR